MGIRDLNNIVRKNPISKDNMMKINTIIIDGSNMIVTYLMRASSDLFHQSPKTEFNTINHNLIWQMKYIIEATVKRGVDTIYSWYKTYSPRRILFVIDPKCGIDYKISSDMQINSFTKNILLGNNQEILFKMKSEEQESRKKATSKKDFVLSRYDELVKKNNGDVILANLFRQSFQFMENCNVMSLAKAAVVKIINSFNERIQNENMDDENSKINIDNILYLIEAADEADLVIKNLGEKYTEKKHCLICSMDTDYFVLFSGNPKIYITGIRSSDLVYKPIDEWRNAFTIIADNQDEYSNDNSHTDTEIQLIPDDKIYDYAIRLAPLFGNDYCRETVISAKVYQNAIKIFYPCGFPTLPARSNIDKFIKFGNERFKQDFENGLIPLERFDEIICNYLTMKNINKKTYLFSVVVYKNWKYFNHYSITDTSGMEDEIMKHTIEKTFTKPDPEHKYTYKDAITAGKYDVIYDWDSKTKNFSDVIAIQKDSDLLLKKYRETKLDIPLTTNYFKIRAENPFDFHDESNNLDTNIDSNNDSLSDNYSSEDENSTKIKVKTEIKVGDENLLNEILENDESDEE